MKVAIITLTLLSVALGANAMRPSLCGCAPDPRGQVCASDFKTYENECWMHCGDAAHLRHVLWWGPCELNSVPAHAGHRTRPVVHPIPSRSAQAFHPLIASAPTHLLG
ncbi:hypothetical protein MSG28_012743 [Choristoneura fumiferana]|uniref:Uncharacterized protein n=1 Tax=Choristoneura fumiferana TaxID=7141 RepID=A0ACC0JHY0_CHOFU|nr:hypothetical protein MSG28_012743 [Choristoneura fumiferana]